MGCVHEECRTCLDGRPDCTFHELSAVVAPSVHAEEMTCERLI